MKEIISAVLIVLGAIFMFIAALGVVRFPDLYTRMHAVTKASSLGVSLMLVSVAVYFSEVWIAFAALSVVVFIFLTAPVAAHLVARAAYYTKVPMWQKSVIDELKDQCNPTNTNPGN